MSSTAVLAVHPNKSRSCVGVNRDGRPVGHATMVKGRGGKPTTWTAFVNIERPPFDTARPGFLSEAAATDFIGANGFAR